MSGASWSLSSLPRKSGIFIFEVDGEELKQPVSPLVKEMMLNSVGFV
jgi:hypothetical protein